MFCLISVYITAPDFVKEGDPFKVSCYCKVGFGQDALYLDWYRNGKQVSTSSDRGIKIAKGLWLEDWCGALDMSWPCFCLEMKFTCSCLAVLCYLLEWSTQTSTECFWHKAFKRCYAKETGFFYLVSIALLEHVLPRHDV